MIRGFFFMLICVLLPGIVNAEEQKLNFAVLPLRNADGVTTGEASLLTDRLRIELFNSGMVNLMEREQMHEVLAEQGFQHSGACTDDACLVEMGQLLGVERMVSGSVGRLGKTMFMLNIRVIDVRTGKLVGVVARDIRGEIEDVVVHLPELGRAILDEEKSRRPPDDATVSQVEAESQHDEAAGDAVKRTDTPAAVSDGGELKAKERKVRFYASADVSGMFIEHTYLGFSPTLGIEIKKRHLIALRQNWASKQSDAFEKLYMQGGGVQYMFSLFVAEKIIPRLGVVAGFWNEYPHDLSNSEYQYYNANYFGGPKFRMDLGGRKLYFTPIDLTALFGARWPVWRDGRAEDLLAVKLIISAGITLSL